MKKERKKNKKHQVIPWFIMCCFLMIEKKLFCHEKSDHRAEISHGKWQRKVSSHRTRTPES